ncbi:hypothetical protein OIO90_002363 [Microbotryomycetes sp. JL221]|nr:hypothetical protein OIO90_002363 [Microbotryomycetes sp. JL221]
MPLNPWQPFGMVMHDDQGHFTTPYPGSRLGLINLNNVKVTAHVQDLLATVNIQQTYKCIAPDDTRRQAIKATYLFPIPDRSVVTKFDMTRQDGKRIIGIVKQTKQAKIDYDKAVKQGKLASLANQTTPDTFSLHLGNVPLNETVTINLTYATELTEDETTESVRFHVPAYVGQRYGQQPTDTTTGLNTNDTTFTFKAQVNMQTPILQLSSPTHPLAISLDQQDRTNATIEFSTTNKLNKDIVVVIKAKDLSNPRCSTSIHDKFKTTAVRLSFIPKFNISTNQKLIEQEYLFLIDRSGSMNGDRIEMAKKSLIVLLRSLPFDQQGSTSFNVLSFGNNCDALWSNGSRIYDQNSLDEATKHVDSMEANYGGTEMRNALEQTFNHRDKKVATSIFLLTDGDAWDLDNVFQLVSTNVKQSKQLLRVFVLGIGDSTSTAMCEGIARRGNGICQFVVDGESFTGKTTRLLKAARMKPFNNVTIQFEGIQNQVELQDEFIFVSKELNIDKENDKVNQEEKGSQGQSRSLFDESADDPIDSSSTPNVYPDQDETKDEPLPRLPTIQTSPYKINTLYPGTRLNVYALIQPLSNGTAQVPTKMTLSADSSVISSSTSMKENLTLEIDIVSNKVNHDEINSNSLHALSVRKLIQTYQDDEFDQTVFNQFNVTSSSSTSSIELKSTAFQQANLKRFKKLMVGKLGLDFKIASSETSFIAIDESKVDQQEQQQDNQIHIIEELGPQPVSSMVAPGGWGGGGIQSRGGVRAAPRMMKMMRSPGGGPGNVDAVPLPPPPPAAPMSAVTPAKLFNSTVPQPFSTPVASAWGSSSISKSTTLSQQPFDSISNTAGSNETNQKKSIDFIEQLARYQQFNGSFTKFNEIFNLIQQHDDHNIQNQLKFNQFKDVQELIESCFKNLNQELQNLNQVVIATVVVLMFWFECWFDKKEEWETMSDKGWKFVELELDHDQEKVEKIKQWAKELFQ